MVHLPKPNALRPPGRPQRLAVAIGLGLAAMAPASHAAPVVAHWTLTEVGTLGGTASYGRAINDAGQVTGYSSIGNFIQGYFVNDVRGFLYSNGTMTRLGLVDPFFSPGVEGVYSRNGYGMGINAAGQVAGYNSTAAGVNRGFTHSNSVSTELPLQGNFGNTSSVARGINATGQVVGEAVLNTNYTSRAFLYSGGVQVNLGTLGGTDSGGYGINDAGQLTGYASNAAGEQHAFLYSNGAMADLGTLGGTGSVGYAINNAGQVTGYAKTAGNAVDHAFLYRYGAMTDLGTLGGTNSYGYGINSAGLVTGEAQTAGNTATRAFLYANGAMTDLNTLNGVAGNGWNLTDGRGINDAGQLTGTGINPFGQTRAFILTLDTTVWEYGYGSSWDYSGGWSHQIAPNRNTDVFIDPTHSLTVSGPTGNANVKRLNVGTDASGGGGIATLQLNGGTIAVVGGASGAQGVVIGKNGVVTGDGVLSVDSAAIGAVFNYGTLVADNVRVQSASSASNANVLNRGLIMGNTSGPAKIVSTYLSNESDGRVRVLTGERLTLQAAVGNYGSIEVLGGQFTHIGGGALENVSTSASRGRIVAQNALLTFQTGVNFSGGQLNVSGGNNNVFGTVTVQRSLIDNRGGQIILSGNSQTAFYDNVDVKSGGELRVSTGSVATFFGQVFQRTGSLFTGTGTKFYEGGLAVGGSPGLGIDSGDVNFGAGNVFTVDIGGTTPCTAACDTDDALKNSSFDKYIVAGHLGLGGTLKLSSWLGFLPQAGQSFDLLDWGSASGSFDSIDSSGLVLPAGLGLDTSHLALDGSISVVAVPEPGTWALMLAGIGLGGWVRRRGARH